MRKWDDLKNIYFYFMYNLWSGFIRFNCTPHKDIIGHDDGLCVFYSAFLVQPQNHPKTWRTRKIVNERQNYKFLAFHKISLLFSSATTTTTQLHRSTFSSMNTKRARQKIDNLCFQFFSGSFVLWVRFSFCFLMKFIKNQLLLLLLCVLQKRIWKIWNLNMLAKSCKLQIRNFKILFTALKLRKLPNSSFHAQLE